MSSITLHTIAKELALSKDDKSDIHIAKYILYGKTFAAEMCKRGFMPIQSVMLDVDLNTNSAKLPENYMQYVRVGSCFCDRILELDYDSTLCVREVDTNYCNPDEVAAQVESDCACLQNDCIPDGYTNYYMWNNVFYQGRMLGAMYTLPAYRSRGFFKIENGRIYLNSVCASDKIVLQYKSTGVSDSGQTEIPIEMKDTILYGMVWKNAFFDRSSAISYVKMCEQEYIRQKDLLTMQTVLKSVVDMLKVEMKNTYTGNVNR